MGIKNIIFDFDGVIVRSKSIRINGYYHIFDSYDRILVDKLVDFHIDNGGLSRYFKIKYFYEKILQKEITDSALIDYAVKYKKFMLAHMIDIKLINSQVTEFLKKENLNFNFHIASGSDKAELNHILDSLNLNRYFLSAEGSPEHKNNLVRNILDDYNYKEGESLLIGDSINDYEAAKVNNIHFLGYNNKSLNKFGLNYLNNFLEIYSHL